MDRRRRAWAAALVACGVALGSLVPLGAAATGGGVNDVSGVDPARKAADLTERANRMRASGDLVHARLADEAAREWAAVGDDLDAAVQAEQAAASIQHAELDAAARADRERALLEERLSANGVLVAQIEHVESDAGHETTSLVGLTRDAGPRDGGAHPAPKVNPEDRP